MTSLREVIIGGGLAGLSAVLYLGRDLFEESLPRHRLARFGGQIHEWKIREQDSAATLSSS